MYYPPGQVFRFLLASCCTLGECIHPQVNRCDVKLEGRRVISEENEVFLPATLRGREAS